MTDAFRKVGPGIWFAVGAVVLAGLAVAVKRATDLDLDFDLNWEDLPA